MLFAKDVYYPIINTSNLNESVEFYREHFDFIEIYNKNGFVLMQRSDNSASCLGLMCHNTQVAKETGTSNQPQGTILNFKVENIDLALQQLDWNGAGDISGIRASDCNVPYFTVRDPNGVTIIVSEPVKTAAENCVEEDSCDSEDCDCNTRELIYA